MHKRKKPGRPPSPNPQVMIGCRVPPDVAEALRRHHGGLKALVLEWHKATPRNKGAAA